MTEPVAGLARDLPSELHRVHLIGMGGAGMSAIARLLLARGGVVTGSDAKDSRVLSALTQLGATVFVGHDAANLALVAEQATAAGEELTVVTSTAIRAANPELAEAQRQQLRVLPRAAALSALMRGRRGVAVAGTHGKTTTTSMLTVALQRAGLQPSFAIGGDLSEPGSNAHAGSGPVFVAEADESDGSFLLLEPYGAIVTNVEPDHLDHYADASAVDEAFEAFVGRLAPDGFLVACLDDPGSARLLALAGARGVRAVSYGTAEGADVRIDQVQSGPGGAIGFRAAVRGVRVGTAQLRVPGEHNARNAAAVLAAGIELGVPAATMLQGLSTYPGVRRRFEFKGRAGGVTVIDDYGHHPTEVAATLAAARPVAGEGRLVVVFQPHRYSRTAAFSAEFGAALGLADVIVVMDVYSAGEDPLPGVSGRSIADAVPPPADRVVYEPVWARVPPLLAALAQPGDLLLTMGAGDVTQLGPEVLRLLDDATPPAAVEG